MALIYEALVQKLQLQTLNISYGIVCQPRHDDGGHINERLIRIVENSRGQFDKGYPGLGIPPLDPVAIPHINFFLYQKGIIRTPIDLYNIDIVGFSEFILDDLIFQMSDLTLRFDINLPELIFNSRYTANGKIAHVIPFKPKGTARVELTNVTVKGVANLQTNSGSLSIKAFHINLEVGKTKVNFSGLLGNGFVNRMLNWVLNRLSDRVVQAQKDEVANLAAIEIMDVANSILKNLTVMDLIG